MKFQARQVVAPRPAVPENYVIFNAPRPIVGDEYWQGEFVSGVFYAAADPKGENFSWILKNNHSMNAKVILYIDEQEAVRQAREYYEENQKGGNVDLEELFSSFSEEKLRRILLDAFYEHCSRTEIDIEEK